MPTPHSQHSTHGDSFSIESSDIERQLIGFTAEEREALMALMEMFGGEAE